MTLLLYLQSAGLMTTVVLTSAALFCVHCMLQQDKAAALHPPMMYACVTALLLLPWDMAFKVLHCIECCVHASAAWACFDLALVLLQQVVATIAHSAVQQTLVYTICSPCSGLAYFCARVGQRGYCCYRRPECSSPQPCSACPHHTEKCHGLISC